ncbi:MAG: archaemetzincin family Zn-dependent metalloprotease [Bacteroidales bacterium]|nr:archaemetzincin family Zn-dependent metalloprotease [Bacteroidales bacterium]
MELKVNDKNILLISFGHFEKYYLTTLAEDILCRFLVPVIIEESYIDLNEYYDPARRQYDGNRLLRMVDSLAPAEHFKSIGLFRTDLFIPILTFIFGQAYFKGRTGIASIYRLRNEQYGMERDDSLLLDRLSKVVIHELGHTFGLVHCHVPDCVMRSGTYVEDIDQKKNKFCSKCEELIGTEYCT